MKRSRAGVWGERGVSSRARKRHGKRKATKLRGVTNPTAQFACVFLLAFRFWNKPCNNKNRTARVCGTNISRAVLHFGAQQAFYWLRKTHLHAFWCGFVLAKASTFCKALCALFCKPPRQRKRRKHKFYAKRVCAVLLCKNAVHFCYPLFWFCCPLLL